MDHSLQLSCFKDFCPKGRRPEITDLEKYWNSEQYIWFKKFSDSIFQDYDLRIGIPLWSKKYGWTYRIGKSGIYLLQGLRVEKNGFRLGNILIDCEKNYALALEYVKDIYKQNADEWNKKIEEKNKKQAERNAKRIMREQEEKMAIQDIIVPEKYNIFHWPAKLDVQKLRQLYRLDAKGMQDTVLVDEVGLTLYLRCKYGKEDMERMDKNIIRCHNCERELDGNQDFRQCSCGYQYSYREYRRSYRRNNMPTGAAAKVFDRFIEDWEHAKDYSLKIILIDRLLHEFHLSLTSGVVHRPVAMNFLEGTRKTVESIIENLAQTN